MKAGAHASCKCGKVKFEAIGSPIVSVICYCDDCQEASRQMGSFQTVPACKNPTGEPRTCYTQRIASTA